MTGFKASIAFLAVLFFADSTIAGEQPLPRQPIGPNPKGHEMLPPVSNPLRRSPVHLCN